MIGITEVNPKNASWNICLEDLNLRGYTAYASLEGRGVVLYVRNTLQSYEIKLDPPCDSTVWCAIQLRDMDKLLVGVVYRSPGSTESQNKCITSAISEIVSRNPSHLLVMGDFNYPGIDWNNELSERSQQEQEFLSSFRDWFLWQHVKEPTRYRSQQTANILDLVMTNEEDMIQHINYNEPVGKSDHLCIDWNLNCFADRIKRTTKVIKYSFDRGIMTK